MVNGVLYGIGLPNLKLKLGNPRSNLQDIRRSKKIPELIIHQPWGPERYLVAHSTARKWVITPVIYMGFL